MVLATEPAFGKVAILGLGLIGGSLALALKSAGAVREVTGWGRRQESLTRGLELGVIDHCELDLARAVQGADVVVVGTPTIVAEQVLVDCLHLCPPATVVTDVASVKGNLLQRVLQQFGTAPPNLVLGHPIAGSEQSGVAAAKAGLFRCHNVILTPLETTDQDALARVRRMWEITGATVETMSVADHDTVLAATSHLPHLLAYTLVDALAHLQDSKDIFRYAAGGFRDFTRIAASDPTMWAEIALANRAAVLDTLAMFTRNLAHVQAAVERGDRQQLLATFASAQAAREEFGRILAARHSANDKETY